MKVEVNQEKVVKEIERLMKMFIEQTHDWFSKNFPEVYWKIYIPAKVKPKNEV